MTSKAERIRALYAKGRSTHEIAEMVGCRVEYVRVVAQQRVGGTSKADKKYYRSDAYRTRNRNRQRWLRQLAREAKQSVASSPAS